MVTRSIVGRFLILAVLLVSFGVIAQAALIITRGGDKKAVKTASADTAPTQASEAAPVRVVYPGPVGDASAQPRKIVDAAPASPIAAAAPVSSPAPGQTAAPPAADLGSSTGPSQAAVSATTPASPVAIIETAPTPAAPPAPVQPVAAQAPPVIVASIDNTMSLPAAPAQPAHAAVPAPASAKGININSAPAEVLNHLQGAGHIGQTIIEHRPYKSVEDLVKKRVLRRSVYEQIKGQIAAR